MLTFGVQAVPPDVLRSIPGWSMRNPQGLEMVAVGVEVGAGVSVGVLVMVGVGVGVRVGSGVGVWNGTGVGVYVSQNPGVGYWPLHDASLINSQSNGKGRPVSQEGSSLVSSVLQNGPMIS